VKYGFSILLVLCLICEANGQQCGGRASFGGCGSGRGNSCGGRASFGGCGGQTSFNGCGQTFGTCESYNYGSCYDDEATTPTKTKPTKTFTIPNAQPIEPMDPEPSPTMESKIIVRVPTDAVLTINGQSTKSTGTTRTYIFDVRPDKSYKFVIHAQVFRDGELLTDTKTVFIKGQKLAELAFDPRPAATTLVTTDMKLRR